MGPICSRPSEPVFSVAVNSPMRDMSGWTGQIGMVNNSLILVVSVYHRIKVGLTLP